MLKKLTAWFRKKNIDMTQGPIGSRLVAFTVPILLGELFQHFYTLADSAIIGNFAGRSALAAVGASESIVRVLVGFFNGVSVGFTVVIARHFGAKDTEKLNRSVKPGCRAFVLFGKAARPRRRRCSALRGKGNPGFLTLRRECVTITAGDVPKMKTRRTGEKA